MTFGWFYQCKTSRCVLGALYSKGMQKKFSILVIALVLFSQASFAEKDVVFRKKTHVYAKKSENSEVLGVYDKGDSLPISSKPYGGWKKVIIDVGGKKKIGWVSSKELRGAHLRDSDSHSTSKESKIPNYRDHMGVGIMGNLSYVYQSKGSLTFDSLGTPTTANYSSLTGANVFAGIFGDFNYSKTVAIRGYFSMRNMKRSGKAEVGGNSGNFILTHNLMALGTTVKFYASPNAIFWWGPGLELAKTTKYSLSGSIGPATVDGEISKSPLYAMLTISAGYDYNLSDRLFVLPEFKFGIVPNGAPMAAVLEILIPIAYTF
jgi:hypothetical protein